MYLCIHYESWLNSIFFDSYLKFVVSLTDLSYIYKYGVKLRLFELTCALASMRKRHSLELSNILFTLGGNDEYRTRIPKKNSKLNQK